MDSLVTAAARALAAGDSLGALKRVALRHDPPALALRGIAMAQLGELRRSRELLRRAARGFGRHEAVARARCVVAEAEVALALRELHHAPRALESAATVLDAQADHVNALHARLIGVRRLLLLGRVEDAALALAALERRGVDAATPSLAAIAALAAAEIELRRLRTAPARAALARALAAARLSRVPALEAEVAEAQAALDRPAARHWRPTGDAAPLRLEEIEALQASGVLVIDACRRGLRLGDAWLSLARRPVLFILAQALAEGWPEDVARDALIARAFRTRRPDDTHRARLRVEIGRLRACAAPWMRVEATARGYALRPHGDRGAAILLPPLDGEAASLQALLADGAAWSTSALALALGESQRTVQRALAELQAAARVRSIGRARAQRWLSAPLAGFTTILLLPAPQPFA